MSHVVKVDIEVKSFEALQRAVDNLGLRMVPKSTYKWYGTHVGDYPLPKGITKDKLGNCTYAIQVPGKANAYEVGVVANADGTYTLLWDFWSGGYGLQDAIGKDGKKLTREYALESATMAAENMGWMAQREGDIVTVYHPTGGTLTITGDGKVDAANFSGGGCKAPTEMLAEAMGQRIEGIEKPEYYQQEAEVHVQGQ